LIDPTRRALLKQIEELSAACPEYRLGQMILNLAFLTREDGDRFLWDVEDVELIAAAQRHLADWNARRGEGEAADQPDPTPATA
jgi:hypothetical protein